MDRTIMTAIATILVGLTAAYFARKQWQAANLQARIAIEKLKYDTYPQRYAVMRATNDYIKLVLWPEKFDGDIDRAISEYIYAINQARFFFSDELVERINSITDEADQYWRYQSRIFAGKSAFMETWPRETGAVKWNLMKISAAMPSIFEEELSLDFLKQSSATFGGLNPYLIKTIIIYLLLLTVFCLAACAVLASHG